MAKQQINLGRNWYAIHTYSGYEDAVSRNLIQRIETLDMKDKIFNVIVPKEKKVKVKAGKRETVEEKIYPGYVFVDMIVDDASWYVVRNTPRVTGFIGAGTTPTPLPKDQIEIIFTQMQADATKHKIDLEVGDLVKIIDGPFKDLEGKISEIDEEHGRAKLFVSMFGRETSIELDFFQIKKL